MKLPAFYRTWRFIIMPTRACHWSLSHVTGNTFLKVCPIYWITLHILWILSIS